MNSINASAATSQVTGAFALDDVVRIEPPLNPALQEAQQSLANGDFTPQMMQDMENGVYTPQELFGANTMYHVDYNVFTAGTHHHFIHIPATGPAQIIVGGPHSSGQLIAEVGDLNSSGYRPQAGDSTQNIRPVTGVFSDASVAWQSMVGAAVQINQAGLYYHGWNQNSNSVAQTVANAAGFVFDDDYVWDGISPGLQNNLQGEMNGSEVPTDHFLFVQGGTLVAGNPDLSDPSTGSPHSIHVATTAEPEPTGSFFDAVTALINDNAQSGGGFHEAVSELLAKPADPTPNQPHGFEGVDPQVLAQLVALLNSN